MTDLATHIRRLAFFWACSFASAVTGYYLMLGGASVDEAMRLYYGPFATLYRMFAYHYQHPMQYITIPCFFYGILATLIAERAARTRTSWWRASLWAIAISVVTIALSSPIGGMLWVFHDMQAGYFPADWPAVIAAKGSGLGLKIGWAVVLGSFPYNLFGVIVAAVVTPLGAKLIPRHPIPATT